MNLAGTRITDAGLEHVGTLKHLESLDLSRTLVTDDGAPIPFGDYVDLSEPVWITWDDGRIMKRQHVTPRGPRITDAGLRHLRGLSLPSLPQIIQHRGERRRSKNAPRVHPTRIARS